ncbi:MAG: 4Fe-4S binding protein [Candidatus Aminicenantes bacterium]|nr:4Fe-4S binding protein [Candidatus Aminicenantes bacterium]
MFRLSDDKPETKHLMLGNEAIARGALEAGVQVVAGYPGTPSSEIIGSLSPVAEKSGIHVEWSTNEIVATEVAGAAAYAGLRSMATMKNAGLNVAGDFLTHFNLSGTGRNGGGMVVVVVDDPGSWSSGDELDSRWLAKTAFVPLLVPASLQEAKDMTKWAFELSEAHKVYCLLWSYTRLSHRTGVVSLGEIPLPGTKNTPHDITELISNEEPFQQERLRISYKRLEKLRQMFENSEYNRYSGPEKPEVLIICCGNGSMCAAEAIDRLNLENKIGCLQLGTIWPLPTALISRYLALTEKVVVLEESTPFIEIHVKEIIADSSGSIGKTRVLGRSTGHVPKIGELTPDIVCESLAEVLRIPFQSRDETYSEKVATKSEKMLIRRGGAQCPGCPHRASYWALKQAIRKSKKKTTFVCNDIGCYAWDFTPSGQQLTKIVNCMGSSAGVASGFGQLKRFGFEQMAISTVGDSTFFHSAIPAIINSVYNQSDAMYMVLDNRATAMTGFQPNPSTGESAPGNAAPVVSIEEICRAAGCEVEVCDPFHLDTTIEALTQMIQNEGRVRVVVLRRSCELIRMRKENKIPYKMWIDPDVCKGEACYFCIKQFKCPSFNIDRESGKVVLGEDCSGCGVCVDICPHKAIFRDEVLK